MADAVIDLASLDTGATTQTDTSTVDAQVTDSASTADATSGNQESQQTTSQTDAAPDKAIREAVRALSQTSPEHAKALKQMADAYYREGTAWKTAFENPQKAAEAKSIIESAGGIEGIAQSNERLQKYDAQDEAAKVGDPSLIESLFTDFPAGAAALAPHYLQKLEATNPQALQAAVGPYAVSMLEQAGIMGHVEAMRKETDPARFKAMADTLSNWLAGQKQNADAVRQNGGQAKNPQADKLKADQEKLATEREDLFRESVRGHVNTKVVEEFGKVVDQFSKQYKLNDTQKAHYKESLEQAVIKEMNGDHNYKKQIDLRYANKQRTRETVGDYIASEFTRRAKDKAFEVAKAIYGAPRGTSTPTNGTGVVKATTPQTAPGGGPLRVSQIPTNDQLDTNRPDFMELRIRGMGYTKAGNRFITWAHLR
jgi:hypothetical protein